MAALAMPASAAAQTDLRSPGAQAAQPQSSAPDPPSEPAAPTVVRTSDDGSETLPLVMSSMALVIALAGVGVALSALRRRPRPRWTAH